MKKLIFISLVLLIGVSSYLVNSLLRNATTSFADAADIPQHQQWFSLKWHGNNIGFVKQSWILHQHNYQWSQLLQIEGLARGKPFKKISQEVLQFSREFPYLLLKGSWYVDSEQQQQYTFVVKPQHIEITQGGTIKTIDYVVDWDAQQLWAPQRAALESRNAGANKSIRLRRWDMQSLKALNYTFNYGTVNLSGEIQAISQRQDSVVNNLWIFAKSGKLQSRAMGPSLTMELSSQSEALNLSRVDVYQSNLLKVDKPLGLVASISELQLEIGELWQLQNLLNGVKTTQQAAGGFLQIGNPGEYETQPTAIFSQHNQRYPDSPRLSRMALSLVSGKPTTLSKIKSIMNFVSEYITDTDEINELTVAEILDGAKGDCSEHALLFVALARAAGIPSREANGLLYLGDSQQKYSAHVWAEVAIDGHWLSIDPTWGKMGLDAGYIRVYGREAATITTLLAVSGKTLHVKQLSF